MWLCSWFVRLFVIGLSAYPSTVELATWCFRPLLLLETCDDGSLLIRGWPVRPAALEPFMPPMAQPLDGGPSHFTSARWLIGMSYSLPGHGSPINCELSALDMPSRCSLLSLDFFGTRPYLTESRLIPTARHWFGWRGGEKRRRDEEERRGGKTRRRDRKGETKERMKARYRKTKERKRTLVIRVALLQYPLRCLTFLKRQYWHRLRFSRITKHLPSRRQRYSICFWMLRRKKP